MWKIHVPVSSREIFALASEVTRIREIRAFLRRNIHRAGKQATFPLEFRAALEFRLRGTLSIEEEKAL